MRNLLLIIFLNIFCLASAQEDNILITSLKVLDGYTETPLTNAHIEILDKATGTVLVDSMKPYVMRSTVNGVYNEEYSGCAASVARRPSYTFRISHAGYETEEFSIDVAKSRLKYVFEKPHYLWKKTRTLDNVSVTASRVLMVMKGDTIEYNAANFRLAQGSMLDDLVKALPGVKLDDNGRITVNGQFVSSLLINGRDFFRGDPKVALGNLPAYTVNKIKVYRKASDIDAQRKDRTEDERRKDPLVMNVGLKREYQQGWIANCEAGGGSALDDFSDGKWLARLFAMRYTNHSSLAIYANANNMSDASTPSGRGEWKKNDNIDGDKTTYMAGIDFSLDPKGTETQINTSLQAKRQTTYLLTNKLRENYYASGNVFERMTATDRTHATELKWNGSVFASGRKIYMYVEPSAYYAHSRRNTADATYVTGSIDSIYSRRLDSNLRQTTWGIGTKVSGCWFLGRDQTIDYIASFSYNSNTSDSKYYDRIDNREAGSDTYQRRISSASAPDYNYLANVTYENSGNQGTKAWLKYRFYVKYEYSQAFNSGRREQRYSDGDWLAPSAQQATDFLLDEANSYHTTRMQRQNTLTPFVGLNVGKTTLNIYSDLRFSDRRINDFRNSMPKSRSKNNFTANPTVELTADTHTGWIGFMGGIENTLPDIMYLLDVRDNSNPLFMYRGNSSLATARKYSLRADWELKTKSRLRQLRLRADYNKWHNSIGMAQIFDRKTSVTTYMPMNVDGNWLASLRANYSQAIDRSGHFMMANEFSLDYRHSVDFSGTSSESGSDASVSTTHLDLQEVNTLTAWDELRLDYRIKSIVVSAKANVKWNRMTSPDPDFDRFTYTDFSYGLSFTARAIAGIDVATDIMVYNRRGYADPSMNTTDWVWNASLQKAFGKRKQWIVKATGFDLLQQLSSIRRTVNAQGRTEIRYNTVPSYATLSLMYCFDMKPKKK